MAGVRSAWAGSIRLAGFPVNVTFFDRVKGRKPQSFKMLDPVHKQPIMQKYVDVAGNPVERSETLRGVQVGKVVHELPPAALEMIEKQERSETVEIDRFASVSSVPLDLALTSFYVVPNEKVPGATEPASIFWNGLRDTGRAAIIPGWCPRAGSKPTTLAIVATDEAMVAYVLPFEPEVNDAPAWEPTTDEKAAATMRQFIENMYSNDDFDLSAYQDEHGARRQAAIDMALNGGEITTPLPEAGPEPTTPNLMAALESALSEKVSEKPKKKAPRKTPAKRAPKKAAA